MEGPHGVAAAGIVTTNGRRLTQENALVVVPAHAERTVKVPEAVEVQPK
jgi:hypothetical protein